MPSVSTSPCMRSHSSIRAQIDWSGYLAEGHTQGRNPLTLYHSQSITSVQGSRRFCEHANSRRMSQHCRRRNQRRSTTSTTATCATILSRSIQGSCSTLVSNGPISTNNRQGKTRTAKLEKAFEPFCQFIKRQAHRSRKLLKEQHREKNEVKVLQDYAPLYKSRKCLPVRINKKTRGTRG
jgi:ribosomal protein L17